MLIVRSTNGVTPSNKRIGTHQLAPYYYCPIQVTMPEGSRIGYRSILSYNFLLSEGPLVETAIPNGTMENSKFVSWKQIVDDEYPLKETYLNDCTHEHIRGDLTFIPKGLDVDVRTVDCPAVFESSWSSIAKVGNMTLLDSKKQLLTVPANGFRNANLNVYILPGQIIHACYCRTYGSPVITDAIFSDIGCLYVGSGDSLGWSKWQDRHVYCLFYHCFDSTGVPQTRLRYSFIEPYPGLSGWYQIRSAQIIENGLKSIHDDDIHHWIKLFCPDSGAFSAGAASRYSLLTCPIDVNMWLHYPRNALQILHDRYYTDELVHAANYAVAVSTQEALLAEKVLDINSIMYVKDFFEVKKLLDSYLALYRDGINPKTVSGAFLATHYGIRLTVKDTKKIVHSAKRLRNLIRDSYDYAYGHLDTQTQNGVRLKANTSIAYCQYDNKWLRFLNVLSTLDFLPTPSRIWDMIPYSFVLDWFIPVGDSLEVFDSLVRLVVVRNLRACSSVEATVELAPSNFCSFPESLECVGKAQYVRYKRTYTANPTLPLPWLPLDEIGGSWNTMRFLSAGALIVQRV